MKVNAGNTLMWQTIKRRYFDSIYEPVSRSTLHMRMKKLLPTILLSEEEFEVQFPYNREELGSATASFTLMPKQTSSHC